MYIISNYNYKIETSFYCKKIVNKMEIILVINPVTRFVYEIAMFITSFFKRYTIVGTL